MSELKPPFNKTEFGSAINSSIHTGSGNIIINNIPNVEEIMTFLKAIVPDDQKYIIEKLKSVLTQLRLYQKHVSELKFVHHMLHELEVALSMIEASMRSPVRQQEVLNIYSIEDMWHIAGLGYIRAMKDFASSEEMKFLGPRYVVIENEIIGPKWLKDLIGFQLVFEASLEEKDAEVVYKALRNMLVACRDHLVRIDRELLIAVTRLEQFSDELLKGLTNVSV